MGDGGRWIDRMLALFGSGTEEETWRDRGPGEGISTSDWYLVDSLPFRRIEVAGDQALAEWARLRKADCGYPIIVGPDEHLIRLAEQWGRQERSAAEIVATADQLAMPECLADLRGRWGVEWEPPVGDWPEDGDLEDESEPASLRDPLTGSLIDKAYLMVLPCRHAHEVPAQLNFGAWNRCPPPEYHVAAIRDWNRRYGVELVALGGGSATFATTSRPILSEESMELAREHFDYCSDVLDLGFDDLSSLAASLQQSDWWHFRWD